MSVRVRRFISIFSAKNVMHREGLAWLNRIAGDHLNGPIGPNSKWRRFLVLKEPFEFIDRDRLRSIVVHIVPFTAALAALFVVVARMAGLMALPQPRLPHRVHPR